MHPHHGRSGPVAPATRWRRRAAARRACVDRRLPRRGTRRWRRAPRCRAWSPSRARESPRMECYTVVPSVTTPSSSLGPAPAPPAATPAMRQYFDVKRQHRDAIVFFRMGDFYEMFYEDALTASRVLELTLTSRAKDTSGAAIPMCGVPFHAVDTYLARLVRKGYRVAICDQVESASQAKGVVRREVTRVV